MANNALIMKNTAFMAIRMIFSLAVSLYTSRVVLQQLGVVDFGIYSIVAGIVAFVAFLRSSLSTAIQRFMNVELAVTKGAESQRVFSASWGCIICLIVVFVVIAEAVGLWYINTKLNIPPGKMTDAHIVFQISVLIVIIEMLRIPYNALIISREKMAFYAYNSIIEVVLKLLLAIALILVSGNKLVWFIWFLVAIAIFINLTYVIYCRKILPALRFSLRVDRPKMKEIGKYIGWNAVTSLSDISYQQGSAMILNFFFGVAYNATMGITNQIKTAVFSFTGSVQSASNPQIVQTFASGQHDEFTRLFIRISKISFFCMAFLGVPILLNSQWLLSVWLADVPPMANIFAKLMIIFCMVDSLVGTLWITIHASGHIARYNIVVGIIWLLCLPLTFLVYKLGLPPYSLIAVMIFIDSLLIVIRVRFTQRLCNVPASLYYKKVILRILCVLIAALAIPLAIRLCLKEADFITFLITSVTWTLTMITATYFIGFTANERKFIKKLIKR